MIKKLDLYIIKKYLFTFLFLSSVMMIIGIVIDLSDKTEGFVTRGAKLPRIVIYYLTEFTPYIMSILGPFFLFISVIFFTSRMTYNSEMIAILSNGISFYRILRPYMIAGLLMGGFFWYANNWLVPNSNKTKTAFDAQYAHHEPDNLINIELMTLKSPNQETNVSLKRFNKSSNEGYQFTLRSIVNNKVTRIIRSPKIEWLPEKEQWKLTKFDSWEIMGNREKIRYGRNLDTALGFSPALFFTRIEFKETMNARELNEYIAKQRTAGSERLPYYQVEKHLRTANAFSIIILTFIGVSVSIRKNKGGLGFKLVTGLVLSATFILSIRFSTTFATNSGLLPLLAVWIPNIIFGIMAILMVRYVPK